jgi:predicted nucleotidyltransferase
MTPESRYLRTIAERNAARLASDPNVLAILLMGSVARGESDRISDIDCAVYYQEIPDEDAYNEILRRATESGGGVHGGDRENGIAVYEYVDGVRCDFAHSTLALWEKDVSPVLEHFEADSPYQKVLGGVLEGIPLYGDEVIATLKEKAAYPDGLARAMIEKHLLFFPTAIMEKMQAERGDLLWLHESLVESQKNVLGVLMGLNRHYHWGEYKRVDRLAAELAIAPAGLAARLRRIFTTSPVDAVREMGFLADETLTLVETHFPDIDLTAARKRLHFPLPPWQMPEE